MICSSWLPLAVLFVSAWCAVDSLAVEVPSGTFSIDNVTIGVTTVNDIKRHYGPAEGSRVSREDEADMRFCYTNTSAKGNSFLTFESGVMEGFKQISGFRLSTIRPAGNCVSTNADVGALETRNRVRLGQRLADFKEAIPVEFERNGSELRYEAVSQRAATQEELKALRARWPNEKQDYFDVTVTLRATFKGCRLIDVYVRKIESY